MNIGKFKTISKMRIFISFLLGLIVFGVYSVKAQGTCDIPQKDGKFYYSEVVDVPNAKEDELFKRGLKWMNTEFTNANGRMDQQEKANGVIEFNGNIRLYKEDHGTKVNGDLVKYKLKIEFKDGRYRYQFYKFHIDKSTYFELEKWLNPKVFKPDEVADNCKVVNDAIEKIISDMKKSLASSGKKQEDNW